MDSTISVVGTLSGVIAVLAGGMAWLLRYLFQTYLPRQQELFVKQLDDKTTAFLQQMERERVFFKEQLQSVLDRFSQAHHEVMDELRVTRETLAQQNVRLEQLYHVLEMKPNRSRSGS